MRWKFGRSRPPEPPHAGESQRAQPLPFEGVLAHALTQEPEANPLAQALLLVRQQVAEADNMGYSRDERDLFHVIDELSQAVVSTYPESLCFAGCGRCCHYPTAFFDVFPQEWDLIRRHLETAWSARRLEAFLERFYREHGPRMPLIRTFEWLMSLSLPLFPTRKALPLACPFLEEQRCRIYEVRPFQCRTYGQFSAKTTPWSPPHVYACADQGERMESLMASGGPQVMLPDVAPFQLKQYAFVDGKRRVLASWITRTFPRRGTWHERLQALTTTLRTLFSP